MAIRKLNNYLDADDSNDEGSQGYDSEIEDLKKGGRSPKRRKVDSHGSEDEEHEEFEEGARNEQDAALNQPDKTAPDTPGAGTSLELPGVLKPLTKKNLVSTQAAIKRSGVVYLSRIPPFMKPTKLRSLLEPYGVIGRIFMTPEDPSSHTRRVRNGGNKKRSYENGWVEFLNKKDAKKACELLNARTIGGKKGTYYHDDVWNLLYLHKFKWNNLTEQIAKENAERSSRMRAEISKATKENKAYVQSVERAKMLEGMESKKAAKRRKEDITKKGEQTIAKEKTQNGERPRIFKQTAVAVKKAQADQPDQVKRVLSKIF